MSRFEVYMDLAPVPTNTSQPVSTRSKFFFKATGPPLCRLDAGNSTALLFRT